MIPEKVNFEMIFPIEAYRNFKMNIEGSLQPGETYDEAVLDAFRKVMSAGDKVYAELKIPMSTQSSINSLPVIRSQEDAIADADLFVQIYSCNELKVLESYKLIVKGKPELQQAYDEMYLKLSQ